MDVEPGVQPPPFLTADLAGKGLFDEIYLEDVTAPAGCAVYLARPMKGPLFRVMPKKVTVPEFDMEGFRLDLFEREE